MAEIMKSETLYDYFLDALEEVTVPDSGTTPYGSVNKLNEIKLTPAQSNLNFITSFFEAANAMNSVESYESFKSLSSRNNSKTTSMANLATFFYAMESLNIPNSESNSSLSDIQDSYKRRIPFEFLSYFTQQEYFNAFFNTANRMNNIESCDSIPSLYSSQSEGDELNLASFYYAMESMNIPMNESTLYLDDLNKNKNDMTVNSTQIENMLYPIIFFFSVWDNFLCNNPA